MPRIIAPALQLLRQFCSIGAAFFILFLVFQCSLSLTLEQKFLLKIECPNPTPWTWKVDAFYRLHDQDGPGNNALSHFQAYRHNIETAPPGSVITVTQFADTDEQVYSINVQENKQYQIDDQVLSIDETESFIAGLINAASLEPAQQVTIKDVIDAQVPTPTRSRVSLPSFSYKDAFPERNDQAEYVITAFNEAPVLAERTRLPENDPQHLPPVEKRLPRNPAVTWGPDGVGRYCGDLRQCTASERHLVSKFGTESFVRFDPSGRVQPALAYKWDISPDFRQYTFYLRKGHKWSDGHPFTSHDIAFACNTAIGSQRWSTAPDWMQPVDGSKAFNILDSQNWNDLRAWILSDNQFARHLRQQAETLGRKLTDSSSENQVVEFLNGILVSKGLYSKEVWPVLNLSADIESLRAKGFHKLSKPELQIYKHLLIRNDIFELFEQGDDSLKDNQISQMNCMLLRAALPQFLRPPVKQRVKVEPVDDADGDDSHIIRFTFLRPNPLFLERTATFMFYRGLFSMPLHQQLRYHYAGSLALDYFDILQWPLFTSTLADPGENALLAYIRSQLTPAELALVSGYTEEEGETYPLGNQQQYKIIAALNRVIQTDDFFKQIDLENIDPEKLMKEISLEHCNQWQLPDWNRFSEYSRLTDLLKGHQQGTAKQPAKDDSIFLNTMLFRLSMDNSMVALNREIGLNQHANRQPKPSRTWSIFQSRLGQFHPQYNPHPPQLNAWRIITEGIERTAIAVRNPYYYRVDIEGNQLPYFDRIVIQKETEENVRLLVLKSGNADFQTRDLNSSHWSVLKAAEHAGNYRLLRWANDYCGELNFYTLQTNRDATLGPILRDARFRQALSLALNREEMIDVFWQGLGTPAQKAVPEGSPYYSAEHLNNYTQYDIDQANALLDELGLDQRAGDGTRLLPNGEPLTLNVHTTHAYLSKVIQMACNYWRQIGVNAQLKQATGASIGRLLSLGSLEIGAVWEGDNYFGPLYPGNYAPSHPAECPHWSAWVSWYHTKGKGGTEPPAAFKQRKALWDKVVFASDRQESFKSWSALQQMTSDELPYMGVTTSPGQVVYVKNGIKNVPRLALAGWIAHQPGNCCPEVFYREQLDDE